MRVDSSSPLGLPSSGHLANDQNHLVPYATIGNLEFCEAETIYIDRTYKASPEFYQLFTVHALYNGQHIRHTVNHIPTSSSYNLHGLQL